MDTGTAAGAQGLVALAAARAARRGLDLDAVEAAALRAAAAVRLVATVDSLERFVRSGRVPGVAGWAGERLRVNPMFEFRQGEVRTLRPVIGKQAALDRILSKWRRTVVPGAALHVAALHGAAEDRGQRLLDAVLHESYPETAFLGAFSAGMIAHTGPGVVGLAWWWDAIST
jgi:DegV family protein with EDD domain